MTPSTAISDYVRPTIIAQRSHYTPAIRGKKTDFPQKKIKDHSIS